MGGVHKKKLRAEKAKVKLKGAKLPKGLNITKTEFKVRKIVIREQLKESVYAEGVRQINLKESLSRLKHHSSSFRTESLRNIRDAIALDYGGLMGALNELIQGISAICLDQEREARRESHKTLSALLAWLPAETVTPFFHIISSYLRCAMTHIQPTIQEDSLLMLDVLLEHIPHLVAAHSAKIFQNFLEMISRVRAEGDKAGRMLTVNMGQKQTTIKWRSKVLLRLQQMLKTLADYKRKEKGDSLTNDNGNLKSSRLVSYSTKTAQYYGVKRCFAVNANCDLSAIFNRSMAATNAKSATYSVSRDESAEISFYIEHLMPLLLESWLEVRPQQTTGAGTIETLISPDASTTLQIVLEIIENLWSLIEIYEQQVNNHDLSCWFQQEYAELFALNFLQDSYPYQQIEHDEGKANSGSKKNNKKSRGSSSPHCLQQNITIAYLMCRFRSSSLQEQSQRFNSVLRYLKTILNSLSKHSASEHLRPLVLALRALLLDNGLALMKQQHKEALVELLRACIKSFLTNKFNEMGIATKILILLCEIAQNAEISEAYGVQEFKDLLVYLPNLLLKPNIHESCLLAMSKLGKQQNTEFLAALSDVLPKVVENLQTIQVAGSTNVLEGKKLIINLFFWLRPQHNLNAELLEQLLQLSDASITDKRISGYCRYVLTLSN